MEEKQDLLAMICREFPTLMKPGVKLANDSNLGDLGITSMEVLTIVISLKRKLGLDMDRVIQSGMPITLGDLVGLVRSALPIS